MTTTRRTLLKLAAAPLALRTLGAQAQVAWPDKPIRIVVGYPAGQTADLNARQFANVISRELGQPVIVDNRPGANGILGAQEVKNSKPDGYTLLWGGSGPLAINPALYKKTPYDSVRDFTPICLVTLGPLYLIANLSFPPNNLRELIAWAKAHPGKADYATAGNGSTAHLAMKMLEADIGMQFNHIPYKGSPAALTDLMGGQIPLMLEAGTSAMNYIKAGKVKALGATGAQRSPAMPDVPTMAEQGVKDFEALAWNAIVAPAGTPAPVINAIAAAVRRGIDDPATVKSIRATGTQVAWMGPPELTRFLGTEITKWKRAVELSGAQVD